MNVDKGRDDVGGQRRFVVALASQYGRYGYRKIAELLRTLAGWVVIDKRVERIWRQELRPEYRDHVWSYDFVEDRWG